VFIRSENSSAELEMEGRDENHTVEILVATPSPRGACEHKFRVPAMEVERVVSEAGISQPISVEVEDRTFEWIQEEEPRYGRASFKVGDDSYDVYVWNCRAAPARPKLEWVCSSCNRGTFITATGFASVEEAYTDAERYCFGRWPDLVEVVR